MEAMEDEIREFMSYVQREFGVHSAKVGIQKDDALVRRPPPSMVRFNR